jgi:hypothetical protein
MSFLTKILLSYDIAYVIIFFYGTHICNKFYNGDVEIFFENAPKAFIRIISFGILPVFFQLFYFPFIFLFK